MDRSPSEDDVLPPLCVDLDGTLVRSDTLWETILQLLCRNPFEIAALVPAYFRGGRSAFKSAAVDALTIDPATLPYHDDVLEAVRQARSQGRQVLLVTGANERLAHAVADHVGLFDGVIGSEPGRNNTGTGKADELAARFGLRQFDYFGNSNADLKVWAKSHAALVVGSSKLKARAAALAPVVLHTPASPIGHGQALLRAIRPELWAIHAVIFLPAFASGHFFEIGTLKHVITGFIALCAFSTAFRILGELLHLPAVRNRDHDHRRPFAAGDLPLSWGMGLAAGLAAFACGLCIFVPARMSGILFAFAGVSALRAWRFETPGAARAVISVILIALSLVAGFEAAGVSLFPKVIP